MILMETVARRFCEKYHVPLDDGLHLLTLMEPIAYKKGAVWFAKENEIPPFTSYPKERSHK